MINPGIERTGPCGMVAERLGEEEEEGEVEGEVEVEEEEEERCYGHGLGVDNE